MTENALRRTTARASPACASSDVGADGILAERRGATIGSARATAALLCKCRSRESGKFHIPLVEPSTVTVGDDSQKAATCFQSGGFATRCRAPLRRQAALPLAADGCSGIAPIKSRGARACILYPPAAPSRRCPAPARRPSAATGRAAIETETQRNKNVSVDPKGIERSSRPAQRPLTRRTRHTPPLPEHAVILHPEIMSL